MVYGGDSDPEAVPLLGTVFHRVGGQMVDHDPRGQIATGLLKLGLVMSNNGPFSR
jgi:hypothetical protein